MRIVAVGKYIPEKRVSNYKKAEGFGRKDSFIDKKIGFRQLSVADKDETILDMCMKAYEDLISKVKIDPDKLDLITTVVQRPDQFMPNMSSVIHNSVGASKKCMAFDIVHACSGYAAALRVVNAMGVKYALIFTADKYSDVVSEKDENVAMIFADGATATLLSVDEAGYEIIDYDMGTLPDSWQCITGKEYIKMDGALIFRNASFEVPESIERVLSRNHLVKDDIDKILLHQATKKIVEFISLQMKCEDKIEFCAGDYGNTGQSSIPMELSDINDLSIYKRLILCGFGAGFSWGTILLQYQQ